MTSNLCESIFIPSKVSQLNDLERNYRFLILSASINLISTAVKNIEDFFDLEKVENIENFFHWCFQNKMMTDWRIGLSLISYLKEKNINFPHSLEESLILFSCSQWTYSDKSLDITIMVASNRVKGKTFFAMKSSNAEQQRSVFFCNENKIKEKFDNFIYCSYINIAEQKEYYFC